MFNNGIVLFVHLWRKSDIAYTVMQNAELQTEVDALKDKLAAAKLKAKSNVRKKSMNKKGTLLGSLKWALFARIEILWKNEEGIIWSERAASW